MRVVPFAFVTIGALAFASACVSGSPGAPRELAPESPAATATRSMPEPREEPAAPAGPVVRALGRCDARGDVARFTIAHLNDMQARYGDRIAGRSRWAYVAGSLRALKTEVPATLVLDAGDDYEKGSIADLRSMGESTRRMIQALPIDARTIGNHDFAYGEAAVLRDVARSAHPVLAANIRRVGEDGAASPFAPFVRIDVGCVRVGIVGLVTKSYGADDRPSDEPFDGVFAQDDRYATALAREVSAHRDEVDVMVALDHLGFWEDAALAARVSGVDVVVGGHSEDLRREPYVVQRADGSHAFVVQAGHYAEHVGRADLAVDLRDKSVRVERYRLIDVDASLPADEAVAALARDVEREAAPDAQRPVAMLSRPIANGRPMAALVWRAARDRWGVDALLVGYDLFWGGLPAGAISLQRLFDSVLVQREPAGTSGFSSLHVVALTGAELGALRAHLYRGAYALFAPEALAPARVYRVALDKRALVHPELAYAGAPRPSASRARYAGELIDVLEAYARARTDRAAFLDTP